MWTREIEIISPSKLHNGTIVAGWFIMVREDLTGMLLGSCIVWSVHLCPEFNLLHSDITRHTESWSESITGNILLNNSHCAAVAA